MKSDRATSYASPCNLRSFRLLLPTVLVALSGCAFSSVTYREYDNAGKVVREMSYWSSRDLKAEIPTTNGVARVDVSASTPTRVMWEGINSALETTYKMGAEAGKKTVTGGVPP